jgi:hypothetical protein
MQYCKNENLASLDTVDNAIREALDKAAPNVFFYDRLRSWVIDNSLYGGMHLD